jgi:hypothetical protein
LDKIKSLILHFGYKNQSVIVVQGKRAVCSEIHMKHRNTARKKKLKLLNDKTGGTDI